MGKLTRLATWRLQVALGITGFDCPRNLSQTSVTHGSGVIFRTDADVNELKAITNQERLPWTGAQPRLRICFSELLLEICPQLAL